MFSLFETFIVVYETKSFTLAGKYLFISQPTVTVRIKKLEEELKSTLFLRGKHQEIIPTEAAILFYPKAIAYLKNGRKTKLKFKKISCKTSFQNWGLTQCCSKYYAKDL